MAIINRRVNKQGKTIERLSSGARRVWNKDKKKFRYQVKDNNGWKTKRLVEVESRIKEKKYATGQGYSPYARGGIYKEKVFTWKKPSGVKVERIRSKWSPTGKETKITTIMKNVYDPDTKPDKGGRIYPTKRYIKQDSGWREWDPFFRPRR